MNQDRATHLLIHGSIRVFFGLTCLCLAVYILYWPESTTSWLTHWLYRLQDPIDGSPNYQGPHDWRNVTAGLAVVVGGWALFSGVADVVYDRRIVLQDHEN